MKEIEEMTLEEAMKNWRIPQRNWKIPNFPWKNRLILLNRA